MTTISGPRMLWCDQDRQGHCHGLRGLKIKNLKKNWGEVWDFWLDLLSGMGISSSPGLKKFSYLWQPRPIRKLYSCKSYPSSVWQIFWCAHIFNKILKKKKREKLVKSQQCTGMCQSLCLHGWCGNQISTWAMRKSDIFSLVQRRFF